MTTLLHLSGSQRCDSYNARLLRRLAQHLQGRCVVDFVQPAEIDLPIFDQDMEADPGVFRRVARLHRRFEACDGGIVACPEYNGQLTPYLKNIIDWVSRLPHIDERFDNPFRGRPLLLCSASTGTSGGALVLPNARALFEYVGCVVVEDSISVPYAGQAWTGEKYDFDPLFDEQIDAAVDRLLQLGQSHASARSDRRAAA